MKIIIVGGGFGGLKLADKLNDEKNFEILLIDRFNYHQFQPLFYQVATASLEPSNISFPLRKAFQKSKNVRIRIAAIEAVIPVEKKIKTSIGEFSFDKLVIATGAETNFFNNEKLAACALPMKSTVEAIRLRQHLIQNFENALIHKDNDALQRLMTIAIAGGGPTGVELAGAISELKKFVLPKDYPELDFNQMKIYLVEGGSRLMSGMSEKSSEESEQYLGNAGITILKNKLVKDYDGKTITFKEGDTLATATLIWAAGIKGNVPEGLDPQLIVRGNRIKVDCYNTVENYPDIYAIGDVAYMAGEDYPNGHPQVASVAIQHAKNLAKNLKKMAEGKKDLVPFAYNDKGSMATIGRNKAVVDIPKPKLHFKGFFAWLIWMFLHLMLILGVKNRLFVFLNWLFNYITYDQSLRLIFKDFIKSKEPKTL